MYDQLARLVLELHEKSRRGTIPWQRGASGNFEASFSNYTVEVLEREGQRGTDIVLCIYNDEGQLIEQFSDEDLTENAPYVEGGYYKVMRDILDTARRTALGAFQAVQAILTDLQER